MRAVVNARIRISHSCVNSKDAIMIGDRMETGIFGGIESGMEIFLVLGGVTRVEDLCTIPTGPPSLLSRLLI